MARKLVFFLMMILLLSTASTMAARVVPAVSKAEGVEALEEQSCKGGVDGEEECLMRRTLNAHVDYLYSKHD
ncbi:hypothetical protein SAY87_008392 [Trapa incisa]|uniref:Phytosulfokine n=2 Tax=Trapa TaxID=22665 RepID=A0AAN7L3A7_TRANT|nr:hypothetical protein SAY87_008392 [Trapa incisa]KAK4776669.1 hypothetical protein SAY86_005357 [Trapa natans]